MNYSYTNIFQLLEHLPFSIEHSQKFINLSAKWEQKFQWSLEEFYQKSYTDFIHRDDLYLLEEAISKKNYKILECRFLHKNGDYVWTKWSTNFDHENQLFIGILEDISDRVNEEDIKEKAKFLNSALSNIPSYISYIDKNLTYQYMNKAYENWFALKENEFIGKRIFDIAGDEIVKMVMPYVQDALKGEEQHFELTLPPSKHLNTTSIMDINYIPDRNENGSVRGFFSITQNITEMKNSTINALERERKLNILFNSMTQGVVLHSSNGEIVEFNQNTLKILGLSKDQLLGKTSHDPLWKVINEDHTPLAPDEHPAMIALKSGTTVKGKIMGVIKQDGHTKWINVTAVPLYRPNELSPYQVLVTFEDIDKFKNLKEALKSKVTWKNAILNGINHSVIATLPDGTISNFNMSAEKMLGYKALEIIHKYTPLLFHDEQEIISRSKILSKELGQEVKPGFQTFIAKVLKEGIDINDWTYVAKDGTRIAVRLTVTAVLDDKGKCVGFLGVAEKLEKK